MSADRNSLLFAVGWMSGIVSRRACSRLSALKCSARSGVAEVAGVWEHASVARVQRRCVGCMKYAESGRTGRNTTFALVISAELPTST